MGWSRVSCLAGSQHRLPLGRVWSVLLQGVNFSSVAANYATHGDAKICCLELPSPDDRSRFDSAMKTIQVNLPDPTAQRLEDAAQRLGVTAEDLLHISIEEKLSRLEGTFHDTADYVISKNKEL